ncbi:ABC transporter ATP-binding protein [Breznakiella homolactica]|uniref:ABC transporter ATP-binding protein n=1 Tax=Breznakiella homolactica TaxID=2798577 RepID=A0A7T7XKB7_9SPIR|nr:ABC transporter ATP-binding protein [Breznakiella homolactica]QQO07989.1 ABC transporter ATP-binding protein [Breznakiella homolactica]
MSVSIRNLEFGFNGKPIFRDFGIDLAEKKITAMLGPSGCGKTTLLRLIGGLLIPQAGTITGTGGGVSFVFQEPRLLPWYTVLENIMLPIEKSLGKAGAEKRARRFLEIVSLAGKEKSYPNELSGGQKQRVSVARAFAYPSNLILMDEPFQSLDIPLRIQLMDTTLSLLAEEPRTLIAVTHDPRESLYLGERIVVLGSAPRGIIFDEPISIPRGERAYHSPKTGELEARLIGVLSGELLQQ